MRTTKVRTEADMERELERILGNRAARMEAQEAKRLAKLEQELAEMQRERKEADRRYHATHWA